MFCVSPLLGILTVLHYVAEGGKSTVHKHNNLRDDGTEIKILSPQNCPLCFTSQPSTTAKLVGCSSNRRLEHTVRLVLKLTVLADCSLKLRLWKLFGEFCRVWRNAWHFLVWLHVVFSTTGWYN